MGRQHPPARPHRHRPRRHRLPRQPARGRIPRRRRDHPGLAKVSAAPALPDDQPAAALWWRITAELGALPETVCVDPHLDDTFRAALAEHLSPVAVNALVTSPSWPSIIDAADLAQRAGWRITDLVTIADHIDPTESDPGQGLLSEGRCPTRERPAPIRVAPSDDVHATIANKPPAAVSRTQVARAYRSASHHGSGMVPDDAARTSAIRSRAIPGPPNPPAP